MPMIDLKTAFGTETGRAYRSKLSIAMVSGRGQAHMAHAAADRIHLQGYAELPLRGRQTLDMDFRVTGEGVGEADFMGTVFPCLIEEREEGVRFILGREQQHRVDVKAQDDGMLTIKADLRDRPRVKLVLAPE